MSSIPTVWIIVVIVVCGIFIFSICACIKYGNKSKQREKHLRKMLRQSRITEKNAEEARIKQQEKEAWNNAKGYPDVPRPHYSTTPSYQTTGFQPAQMQPSPPPLTATPATLPVPGFAHSPPRMQSPNYGWRWSPNQPPAYTPGFAPSSSTGCSLTSYRTESPPGMHPQLSPLMGRPEPVPGFDHPSSELQLFRPKLPPPIPPSPPRMTAPGFAPSSPGHHQPIAPPSVGWTKNESQPRPHQQPSILRNPYPLEKPVTKVDLKPALVVPIPAKNKGRSVRSLSERSNSIKKREGSKSDRKGKSSKKSNSGSSRSQSDP